MAKKLKLTHEEQQSEWRQPPCAYCKHLLTIGKPEMPHDPLNSLSGWTCKAFPEEIPTSILSREEDHLQIDEGQAIGNNYTYESKVFEFENGLGVYDWDGTVMEFNV